MAFQMIGARRFDLNQRVADKGLRAPISDEKDQYLDRAASRADEEPRKLPDDFLLIAEAPVLDSVRRGKSAGSAGEERRISASYFRR